MHLARLACRIRAFTRFATLSMFIVPITDVFIVFTGLYW